MIFNCQQCGCPVVAQGKIDGKHTACGTCLAVYRMEVVRVKDSPLTAAELEARANRNH